MAEYSVNIFRRITSRFSRANTTPIKILPKDDFRLSPIPAQNIVPAANVDNINQSIRVLKATPEEMRSIHQMDLQDFSVTDDISNKFQEYLEDNSERSFFSFKKNGKFCGYISFEPVKKGLLYIYSIGIKKEHRNTKTAYAILKQACEFTSAYAKEHGANSAGLHVDATNEHLVRLCKKFGFEIRSTHNNYYDNGAPAYYMKLAEENLKNGFRKSIEPISAPLSDDALEMRDTIKNLASCSDANGNIFAPSEMSSMYRIIDSLEKAKFAELLANLRYGKNTRVFNYETIYAILSNVSNMAEYLLLYRLDRAAPLATETPLKTGFGLKRLQPDIDLTKKVASLLLPKEKAYIDRAKMAELDKNDVFKGFGFTWEQSQKIVGNLYSGLTEFIPEFQSLRLQTFNKLLEYRDENGARLSPQVITVVMDTFNSTGELSIGKYFSSGSPEKNIKKTFSLLNLYLQTLSRYEAPYEHKQTLLAQMLSQPISPASLVSFVDISQNKGVSMQDMASYLPDIVLSLVPKTLSPDFYDLANLHLGLILDSVSELQKYRYPNGKSFLTPKFISNFVYTSTSKELLDSKLALVDALRNAVFKTRSASQVDVDTLIEMDRKSSFWTKKFKSAFSTFPYFSPSSIERMVERVESAEMANVKTSFLKSVLTQYNSVSDREHVEELMGWITSPKHLQMFEMFAGFAYDSGSKLLSLKKIADMLSVLPAKSLSESNLDFTAPQTASYFRDLVLNVKDPLHDKLLQASLENCCMYDKNRILNLKQYLCENKIKLQVYGEETLTDHMINDFVDESFFNFVDLLGDDVIKRSIDMKYIMLSQFIKRCGNLRASLPKDSYAVLKSKLAQLDDSAQKLDIVKILSVLVETNSQSQLVENIIANIRPTAATPKQLELAEQIFTSDDKPLKKCADFMFHMGLPRSQIDKFADVLLETDISKMRMVQNPNRLNKQAKSFLAQLIRNINALTYRVELKESLNSVIYKSASLIPHPDVVKNLEFDYKYLSEMLSSVSSGDFRAEFKQLIDLLSSAPNKPFSELREGLQHNQETKDMFKLFDLNYDKWIKFDKNSRLPFSFSVNKNDVVAAVTRNILDEFTSALFNGLDKAETNKILIRLDEQGLSLSTLRAFGSSVNAHSPQKLKDFLNAVRDVINVNPDYWHKPLSSPNAERQKNEWLDHILKGRFKDVEDLLRMKDVNMDLSVRLADTDDVGRNLFLGNHVHCCTSVGNFNGHAAPQHLMNSYVRAMEIVDKAGNSYGNSMGYFALVNGRPSFIIDSFEANGKLGSNTAVTDAIIKYAQKVSSEVAGKPIPIYFGPRYNKLDMRSTEPVTVGIFKVIGSSPKSVYLDTISGWRSLSKTYTHVPVIKLKNQPLPDLPPKNKVKANGTDVVDLHTDDEEIFIGEF